MKALYISFLLIFFSLSFNCVAQKKQKNWRLNGYVKDMQSILFTEVDGDWMSDNLIHNRLNFKWYMSESLTLDIEMRNRFMYGDFVKNIPDYAKIVDDEKGFLDMSDLLINEKSFLLHSSIDRAWIDYTRNKLQLRIGRQRINWALTFAWNPNDLFNTYSFFDFDYEEKPGSDAVRLQYYTGMTSLVEIAVKADYNDRITAAGMYRFNKWGYDMQFLGGMLNEEDLVVGAGWSGPLLKGGLRGECSFFQPKDNLSDTTGAFLASLGYDYTFKNSLMVQTEVLYNSKGKEKGDFNLNEFYFMDLSSKNLSLTRWSVMGMLSYPITPLLYGSVSAMYSPNDKSLFVGPTISYSLAENLDFSLVAQSFFSDAAAGGKGTFVFLRIKKSF
ncbi:MAG: hypothetical protein ISR55_04985 [Bacteroidetes bacterium]|nr:hypothetical protein [Bacteroidota bacterium]